MLKSCSKKGKKMLLSFLFGLIKKMYKLHDKSKISKHFFLLVRGVSSVTKLLCLQVKPKNV